MKYPYFRGLEADRYSFYRVPKALIKVDLATLYNAPVTVDSYYSAQVRHEFGWGSRVDKS